ncbi:MAG: SGNH/GDSL hydrolase family protein [Pseudomonadota bacterium]
MRTLIILLICLAVPASAQERARIVILGDSVMEWNNNGTARAMAEALGEAIRDESTSGARFSHRARLLVGPMDIRAQLPNRSFDWVVVNGGANDLAAECDCADCSAVLDQLITADGQLGEIPDFVKEVRADGAQILWAQYYDSPVGGGPFSECSEAFAELDSRLDALAAGVDGLHMADLSDVIEPANLGHYDNDRVHPSALGSQLAGTYLADVIRSLER